MTLIAQITDLHMRPRGGTAFGFVHTNVLAARAVETLRALRPAPDVVLVTGDLTDQGEPAAFKLAAQTLGALQAPVLVMPGNHDRREPMRSAFADWPGMALPGVADRLCYSYRMNDMSIIVLDSLVEGEPFGLLGSPQLDWLGETLAHLDDRPVMIALHHPPIRSGIATMDGSNLQDADLLAEVLASFHKVRRVVCGHVHRSIIGQIAHVPVVTVPGVAHQVALSLDGGRMPHFVLEPPAFALHHMAADGALSSHLAYVERFDGPYPFMRDESVDWTNTPPA